jgi:hypothetical protein
MRIDQANRAQLQAMDRFQQLGFFIGEQAARIHYYTFLRIIIDNVRVFLERIERKLDNICHPFFYFDCRFSQKWLI